MPAGAPTSPAAAASPRSLTASWLLKLGLAVGAPALLLLGLEAGFRLAGFHHRTDFFIPDSVPGVYRTNPRYTELFFPASFGLKPLNFRLTKTKPPGTCRVFVLGESAAMGVPEPGFGLAPQLRAQLRAVHPGDAIEVWNLGITAINSHVIRHLVRQVVDFSPDLLVVYMGNNEVVGPYGAASAVGGRTLPLPLIRASIWLRSSATGQALQQFADRLRPAGRAFQDWRGMEMFAGKALADDDPRLAAAHAGFAANLADIIVIAEHARVPVVLSTVAVNLRDCAPFISLSRSGLSATQRDAWQQAQDEAARAVEAGDAPRAEAALQRALQIDPSHANTHFQLASLLAARGDPADARTHYLAALQFDALRFRADARINDIIRDTARSHPATVALADAAVALGSDARSSAPPAGHDLFFEHVHLTWEGNYALARLLAAPCAQRLFALDPAKAPWLDADRCAAAVGFTDFGRSVMVMRMEELTERPPFTHQASFSVEHIRLLEQITALQQALSAPGGLAAAAARVDAALLRDPVPFLVFHAATIAAQRHDLARALELNQRLDLLEPPAPENAAQRAFLLQELSRPAEAEALLLASARINPYYFQTYGLLARVWAATGDSGKALAYFRTLVDRMPGSLAVRHAYAGLLNAAHQPAAAEEQWVALLRLAPDDEAALTPLTEALARRGDLEEALTWRRRAHAYNPAALGNNIALAQIYEQRGDLPNTVKFMQAAAASGHLSALQHVTLAFDLLKLDRRDEMLLELRRSLHLAQQEGDAPLLRDITGLLRDYTPRPR